MFTAIGLKKFNEVDFTSLLKGGAALLGLNEIAQTFSKRFNCNDKRCGGNPLIRSGIDSWQLVLI